MRTPRWVWGRWACLLFLGAMACARGPDRLFLIGLDAANWDSMDELMASGDLPHLARLVRRGVAGPLATYVPTASPALWTTIATGHSPDKHGIAFRVLRVDGGGEHEMLQALSSQERRVPALWNLLSDAGIRSAFVGWWATWPAEEIDGYIVTDRVGDPGREHTTYPPELRARFEKAGIFDGSLPPEQEAFIREVQARFAAWRRKVEEGKVPWRGEAADPKAYLDDVEERLRVYRRIMAMDYATERMTMVLLDHDPSIRVVAPYFWYLDVCQHLLWKYWRPEGFTIDPEEQRILAPLIPSYYRFLDGVVGRLCARGRGGSVAIVSDHGMESSTAERCINDLFDVEGLLEDMGWLVRASGGNGPDFARSRAYVRAEARQLRLLNVCLAGREPGGWVPPEDKEALVATLVRELGALHAEPSGEPLFKDVRALGEGERAYRSGEFVVYTFEEGDVVASINLHVPSRDSVRIGARVFPLTRWNRWHPSGSGQHTEGPPGIIVLAGKQFRRGVRLQGARIYDVAPTVLGALGLPVARDLEGRVLVDAFSPRFMRRHPIATVETFGERTAARRRTTAGSDDEALLERLRSLGYLR